jgi:hypothetical protein
MANAQTLLDQLMGELRDTEAKAKAAKVQLAALEDTYRATQSEVARLQAELQQLGVDHEWVLNARRHAAKILETVERIKL